MNKNQPTILIAGGAGYIGSHTVLSLNHAGYNAVILDNLIYGHRPLLKKIFSRYNITVGLPVNAEY